MKNMILMLFAAVFLLSAETLFQVKDSSDRVVLDVSSDGLRVLNEGDTVMVISSSEIKAVIDNSKALSRSFTVATSTSAKGQANVMEITTDATTMREGNAGNRYTDFSPENIFIGLNSGISATPGSPNTYSGKTNVFLGNESGISNTSGGYNIMIGDKSGYSNTTGGNNLFIGNNSGETNSIGSWNLFVGHGSGAKNTGDNNMFVGHNAGATNNTGISNLFLGTDAGAYNTGGTGNVFVGQQTGIYNTTGDNNTFIGRWAGNSNQSYSDDNTMVGSSAGSSQTTGNQNTYIGSNAGKSKTSGYYNTFTGFGSGQNNGTGGNNSFYGYHAGYNNTGYYNTFLGMQSGYSNDGSSNVFIGYRAGYNETASNKLFIANTDTSTPLIKGTFPNTDLTFKATNITADGNFSVTGLTSLATLTASGNSTFNGNMGIGTSPSSSYTLHVTDSYYGLRSEANTSSGDYTYGLYGRATGASVANYAVRGYAYSTTGGYKYGIYGYAGGSGPCFAGYFSGNVHVTGTLSQAKQETKIDHPLDPENKYLNHSSVSSDEMKNIYDGIVFLDNNGNAVVDLPDWFEALNTNFRYQMTSIGKPSPNLYVSKKISNGTFEIAGGDPGTEICWQITGTRKDNYAKSNPLDVETAKSTDETGLYMHPESFGMAEERGIDFKKRED
jgi:hypothetical protein